LDQLATQTPIGVVIEPLSDSSNGRLTQNQFSAVIVSPDRRSAAPGTCSPF
jgi:hypothetical protein